MRTGKHQNISAYILAGGQSRRFGTNKALVSYHGRPLIAHLWEILSGCFESVAIVAKPDSPYRSLGFTVVDDVQPGQSPLIGIYTGLLQSETDWNFFTACDMPFLTCRDIEQLIDALNENSEEIEIVVPVSSSGPDPSGTGYGQEKSGMPDQGVEPLAALYHRSLIRVLDQQENTTALRTFIRSRKYITVEFESTKPFTNVNTKSQFARIDR